MVLHNNQLNDAHFSVITLAIALMPLALVRLGRWRSSLSLSISATYYDYSIGSTPFRQVAPPPRQSL